MVNQTPGITACVISPPRANAGITLTEQLVVAVILAIIATAAIPSYHAHFEKVRVRHAAEEIFGLILQAKTEGPIRDQNLSLTIDSGAWCLGFSASQHCDCTLLAGDSACTVEVAGEPVRQVVSGDDFPAVAITSNFPGNGTSFNRLRGNASPGGSIAVISGKTVAEVRVGVSGRVRLCAAQGSSLGGYPPC